MGKNKLLKRLMNKALKLWKIIVKNRAGGVCEICGSDELVQIHHIIPYRLCKALRYDPNNGVAVCSRKHHRFGRDAMHVSGLTPYLYLSKYPEVAMYLEFHRNDEIEYTKEVLEKIIAGLEALIEP